VGESCPSCQKGKLYEAPDGPETLVRVVGRAPLDATITELEKLRCNLCHEIFTAPAPPDVGEKKYDETAGSMIALLRYGAGLPSYRLACLQGNLGIPLPTSTQWDIAADIADLLEPVLAEHIRQAAQGELFYNDDTTMRILELMGKRREKAPSSEQPADRKGMFTTGIVSEVDGHRIILFFTGWKYAGENLAEVLAQRAAALQPPKQMCDGLLSRNLPKGAETILGGCNAHSRRNFVEVAAKFPEQCRYVIEALGEVYHNDKLARERALSAEERLRFHQSESGPVMERLERWVREQLEEKKVEPNSGLGQAMSYMLDHWQLSRARDSCHYPESTIIRS
jgi:transposase